MLTKTFVFSDDVLDVLREIEWDEDGRRCMIRRTLPHKLYEEVNKALLALGGRWTRSAGGHLFQSDPRPMVEGLLEDGRLVVARDGFFETPQAVSARIFHLSEPSGMVLEPSAGLGAIARAILAFPRVTGLALVEINQNRAGALMGEIAAKFDRVDVWWDDFLKCDLENLPYPGGFDRVYMNPPFEAGQDQAHVFHAYQLLAPGGVLVAVMSEGSFFRQDRKSVLFREFLDAAGHYTEKLPEKSFRASGTDVATRLVMMHK